MKIENCKLKIAKRKGFTLIEMLVVVFVLGVGLLGALSFFNINLNNQFEAKNELIAVGLAQEGADLARNVVDYDYLNGNIWYGKLTDQAGSVDKCKNIDFNSLVTHDCIVPANQNYICTDADKRYYSCNDSAQTFSRILTITGADVDGTPGFDLDTGDCLNVHVSVKWNNDSRETESNDIICKPRQ